MARKQLQPDLFDAPPPSMGSEPRAAPASLATADPSSRDDAALLAAVQHASQSDVPGVVDELVRRRVPGVTAALEALCRRFIGFGLTTVVLEQAAALDGLRRIGGRDATQSLERLITAGTVQGPGLLNAVTAAAALRARLPPVTAVPLLRHPDPRLRAAACRCVRSTHDTIAILLDLLTDLHDEVAMAAALTLAEAGRTEARRTLALGLMRDPSTEIVDAFAQIADADGIVLLGRVVERHPDLAPAVLASLDTLDDERAAKLVGAIRRRLQAGAARREQEDQSAQQAEPSPVVQGLSSSIR